MYAKKSLGQNFLNNPEIIEKIISCSKLSGEETVLEIGPGEGVLTRALLQNVKKVIAVEKDDRLFAKLHETFAKEISEQKLILVHGDILEILSHTKTGLTPDILIQQNDLLGRPKKRGAGVTPSLFGRGIGGEATTGFIIIANIPYYITGEFLRAILSGKVKPCQMTLMLQKEVAKRIAGKEIKTGGETSAFAGGLTSGRSHLKESLLSLSVKCYGIPSYVMTVGRENFTPAPNVDSAILLIKNINNQFFDFTVNNLWKKLWIDPEQAFFGLIHAGFSHKRKVLVNNLSSMAEKKDILTLFSACKISEKARAENLNLDDWKNLLVYPHP